MEMKDAKKCATCAHSFDECLNLHQNGRTCSTGNGFAEWKPKQPASKPQCETRAALFREFARVLEMCEAAGVNQPGACVKMTGYANPFMTDPFFNANPMGYEFAIAIVEGKPVWRGDVLWSGFFNRFVEITGLIPSGGYFSFASDNPDANCSIASCSWNPPKPATISINGVEVKAPLSVECSDDAEHPERHGVFITFKYYEDAEAFKAALEGR